MSAELPDQPGPAPPLSEQALELRRLLEGATFTAGEGLLLRGRTVEVVVTSWSPQDDPAPEAPEATARIEAAAPEDLGELLRRLREGDPSERQKAARAVGSLGTAAATPEVLGTLAPLVFADDWRVAAAAAEAVDRLGRGDAIESYLRGSDNTQVPSARRAPTEEVDALVCAFGTDGKRLRLDEFHLWVRGGDEVGALLRIARPGERGALVLRELRAGDLCEMRIHVLKEGTQYESADGRVRAVVRREADRRTVLTFATNDHSMAGAAIDFSLAAESGRVEAAGEVQLEEVREGRWEAAWVSDEELSGSCGLVFEVTQRAKQLRPVGTRSSEWDTSGTLPSPVAAAEPHGAPGEVAIPGYEGLGQVGAGGFGVVYKAVQQALGRVVALKVIRPDWARPEAPWGFRAEVEALARLRHPHVVTLYEAREHQGVHYLALEFCDGGTLTQKLAGTPLPPAEAAQLVETLARAIHTVHQVGVIHRNLKPHNVLLTADGKPKIAGFSLARKLDGADWLEPEGIVGTPSYMSPEQATGQGHVAGPATDVYGLGAVLYECLTGRPPFKGATPRDTLRQVLEAAPTPPRRTNRDVPRDLEAVCLRSLRKDPTQRYATAEALAEDLRRYREGRPVLARSPGVLGRLGKWARRQPALAASLAALLLVCVTSAALTTHLSLASRQPKREAQALQGAKQAARDTRRMVLASAGIDGAVELWDARSGALLSTLGAHTQPATAVAFSPDGIRLACASADGVVRVWDVQSGAPTAILHGHTGEVTAVAYSPDGRRFASAADDNTVLLWDTESGAVLATLRGHSDFVTAVAYSPDSAQLASASWDQTVRLWDAARGALILSLVGHTDGVLSVAYSPDGGHLASASEDGTVRVWDLRSRLPVATLRGHTGPVNSVAYSPDGTRLASASQDRTVKLWDAKSGAELLSLRGHTGGVYSVCVSPDGSRLASAGQDNTVKLWDAGTGAEVAILRGHTSWVTAVAFSPDGSRLASAAGEATGRTRRAPVSPRLPAGTELGLAALETALAEKALPQTTEEARLALARRRANAAAALAAMGRWERVLPLLRHGPDPTVRSYLIEHLGSWAVGARALSSFPESQSEVSVRRALVLAHGDFDPSRLPPAEREQLIPKLLQIYRHDPDPGMHAAAGWLLQGWGQQSKLAEIDRLLTRQPAGARGWYVNGQGQTMVVVPPGEFVAGEGQERLRRKVRHAFALAAKEVTAADFLRFRPKHSYDAATAPTADCPVNSVTWYEAAEYCNWLSRQEGIPEDQWCYAPNAKGQFAAGMRIPADCLRRAGYRLPTEAEWEYACRAGSETAWSPGQAVELLGRYAWIDSNASGHSHPVGGKRPNDWGLFDMHGNACEWCQDQWVDDPADRIGDNESKGYVTDKDRRLWCGGAFRDPATAARSGDRGKGPPGSRAHVVGFRTARTSR
jgi:WD40 repeat protein/formylglycine-generating enzyme required for sulfatase activity